MLNSNISNVAKYYNERWINNTQHCIQLLENKKMKESSCLHLCGKFTIQ